MMHDVVTFGEAMLRFSPSNFGRLEQAHSFEVEIGGSELNVAVGVARLGMASAWVSKLPQNPLGRMVRNRARELGVDTAHVIFTDRGRQGLYFVEYGAAPRASSVLYDRGDSSISLIEPGDLDWRKILPKARLFHVSGITPALSSSAAETTGLAMKAAKEAGCLVSYDLNYRKKLWSPAEARKEQEPLMKYVDLFITTEEDAGTVFGIQEEDYRKAAEGLAKNFGFKAVAITLREDLSVWKNHWTAIAYSDGKIYSDKTYVVEIVDRVGAGDSFSAGFIYGFLTAGVEKGVQYGNALAALKHTMRGDFNWATREEVEAQIKGAGLRISR
jgi:2-dehydro-3-deoxygluconokinase